jgi:hypothetical protein
VLGDQLRRPPRRPSDRAEAGKLTSQVAEAADRHIRPRTDHFGNLGQAAGDLRADGVRRAVGPASSSTASILPGHRHTPSMPEQDDSPWSYGLNPSNKLTALPEARMGLLGS